MHEHVASAAAPEAGVGQDSVAEWTGSRRDESPGVTFGPPGIWPEWDESVPRSRCLAGLASAASGHLEAPPSCRARRAGGAREASRPACSLHQAAEAHDRDVASAPREPVLAALGDAASATSTAPATVAPSSCTRRSCGPRHVGRRARVQRQRDAWDEAANYALRVLASKKLRMPSYAQCAEMKIEGDIGLEDAERPRSGKLG